jgi:3-phenylpropionate/trans-cinnamate dioxygenase ferredoxin reductase subunit
MTHPSRVVVVGASAAGLAAAETLRREGFDGAVCPIGAERHAPYDRPPLSKQILAGTWPAERARLRDDQALADLGLDLRLGVRAVAADPERRLVWLDDGERVGYDELVIATGVRARRLPGTDGVAGVHTLRELDDALALRDALDARRRLVVLGAGFLGAEAASVAAQAGADVTLVSDLDAPLADVVGTELGELLLRTHAEQGVRVFRRAKVDG